MKMNPEYFNFRSALIENKAFPVEIKLKIFIVQEQLQEIYIYIL